MGPLQWDSGPDLIWDLNLLRGFSRNESELDRVGKCRAANRLRWREHTAWLNLRWKLNEEICTSISKHNVKADVPVSPTGVSAICLFSIDRIEPLGPT